MVSLVIDSNWRWVHNIGGYQNCFSAEGWNDESLGEGMIRAAKP